MNLPPIKSQFMTLTDATSDALQQAILNGTFPPGSQLLPEVELMHQLGVSRSTLREALKRLEEQGLIARRRGLGTYVREKSIVKDLSINFGISDMIREAGLNPGSLTTEILKEKACGEVSSALALAEGTPVIKLERVRTANNRPVVLSIDYLPADLFGDHPIQSIQLENRSLYQYLCDELQLRVVRGVARISPVTANARMAAQLAIRRRSPLLRIVQIDYNAYDRPLLYSVEYHLPDSFIFLINRKGPHR